MRSREEGLFEFLEAFGSRIEELRLLRGLSRPELAELAGLHVNTVVNMERGQADGSILATNLVLMNLGCVGVQVTRRGFEPVYSRSDGLGRAFPGLTTNKAQMAAIIGEAVHRKRIESGASIEQVADMAGIHRNTIRNVEMGLVSPSIGTVYRLYRSLGVRCVAGSNEGISLLT